MSMETKLLGEQAFSPYDTYLERALRIIAVTAAPLVDPDGWSEKYGVNFENDVFMMHRFCWCDDQDCPWCGGCTCPESAFSYFVDGKKVSYEEWMAFFDRLVGTSPSGGGEPYEEWKKRAKAANQRRSRKHVPVCEFCLGKGVFATNGAEPGKGAPNFWYKPSGLKVWWYKYIGRDTTLNRPVDQDEVKAMIKACLASLRNIRK